MALVEALKDKLLTSGAVRVRIETQRGSTLPIEAIEKPTPATRSSARQVITQLVEETNTTDREALKSLVEKLMNEEGL